MKEISIKTATSKFLTWYDAAVETPGRIALIVVSRFAKNSDNLLTLARLLHQTFAYHGFRTMTYCHTLWEPECSAESIHENFQESLANANACLNWIQNQTILPEPCWLIGFGYGAWTSMQMLMRRPESEYFISLSTPVGACDFSFLAPCPVTGLFVHGAQDKNFGKFEVTQLVKTLTLQKNLPLALKVFPRSNHNFGGHEKELIKFLLTHIPEMRKKFLVLPPADKGLVVEEEKEDMEDDDFSVAAA